MRILTICLLGNFAHFFVVCCFFSKLTFPKNSFRNMIRVSNSLDPDQVQHFVGPDLGPIYKGYQQTTLQNVLYSYDLAQLIYIINVVCITHSVLMLCVLLTLY